MKKIIILFLLVICAGAVISVVAIYPRIVLLNKKKVFIQNLEKALSRQQKQFHGNFSFYLKDLNYPYKELTFNPDKEFPAASLIKVPLLAVAFQAVKEKRISLDTPVAIKRKDVTGGSGVIKAVKLPIAVRFRDLLELMIRISDNTATNKVIGLLGFDYINRTFRDLGLTDTSLKRKMMDFSMRRKGVENFTTVVDIAFLLEKIYNKTLIDSKSSELMLAMLKHQKVNDRLPLYLPSTVTVAHKTGLERGVVHDAGIVFSPKGNYIICVLTRGPVSYATAKKFIAHLSLVTYDLYQ